MTRTRPIPACLALAAALAAPLTAAPAPPPAPPARSPPPFPIGEEEGPMVEATLWVEQGQVVPGAVVWVAVALRVRPGWHIYWPGQNDTGMPPIFDWTLPDGWEIGAARWPAPTRLVSAEGFVDHVLEGIPTVLFPVRIPESADAGAAATISCDLEWLVCRELCVAERQRVRFTLAAFDPGDQSTAARPQDAAVIAMARREIPPPLSGAPGGLTASVTGNTLTIRGGGGGALSFAPAADGRHALETHASCIGEGGGPLYVGLEDAPGKPVLGVVTVRPTGSLPRSFTLSIPETPQAELDGFEIPADAPQH